MLSAKSRALFSSGRNRHRLLAEDDGAKPPAVAAAQRQARGIEGDVLAGNDAIGKMRLDFIKRDWRGRENAALRGAAGEFGHRQEWLARERGGGIEIGAAAVRQQKRTGGAAAVFGDAFRKGQRDQRADA